jgi:glucose-6-phosphate isomerase
MPTDRNNRPREWFAPIELDYTNVMAEAIGLEHGLTIEDFRNLGPRLEELIQELQRSRLYGRPEFLELPSRLDIIGQVRTAAPLLEDVDTMVLLGIGGSALGPRAILEAAWGPNHILEAGRPGGPERRVFIADNIDPESFAQLLDLCDPRRTLFNVISKSGSTVETMAQLAIAWARVGDALPTSERARRFLFTTDANEGFLRNLAVQEGIQALEIPAGVGGRYSVLTAVGLFPSLASGIDPEELLEGAGEMDARCRSPLLLENPAACLAAVHYLMDRRKGKTVTVLMPYSDRLRTFADWFCQLWAESLGKSHSRGGELRAPVGQTPVRAVGTTDQHSQLQLYLEGPNDKLLTLALVERLERDIPLRSQGITDDSLGLEYLRDHTLGDVFRTEGLATEMALAKAERPTLVWRLPAVSPHVLGQLFYVYEVACALAGGLYHVDPYDQPGVEEGKQLTYGALGRRGFEDKKEEMTRYRERGSGYRV